MRLTQGEYMTKNLILTFIFTALLCVPSFAGTKEPVNYDTIKFLIDSGNANELRNYLSEYQDDLETILNTKITPRGFAFSTGWEEDFCQAPMHYAAATGKQNIVELFLELAPESLELPDPVNNATPLWCANFNGKLHIVDYLHFQGAKLDVEDKKGYDTLMITLDKGYPMSFSYFLNHGVKLIYRPATYTDLRKIFGDTSLNVFFNRRYSYNDYAKEAEHRMFYALLLKHQEDGKDFNMQDENGKTPLMYAVKRQDEYYVSALITRGADLDIKDNNNNTACNYAVRYPNKEIESMVCVSRKIIGIDIADISRIQNKFKDWFNF